MTTNNDQVMNTETNITTALSDPKSLAAMTDAVLADAEAGDVTPEAIQRLRELVLVLAEKALQ